MQRYPLIVAAAAFSAAAGFYFVGSADHPAPPKAAAAAGPFAHPNAISGPIDVKVPDSLSASAQAGAALFNANCAACHGANAAGTLQGPPLVHVIYVPSHHGDRAFDLAVMNGVRAHHWRFGDMPPIAGVEPSDVEAIVAYVRELQRHNGVE